MTSPHAFAMLALALAAPLAASAQEGPYKVEALAEAPPADVAAPLRDALGATGHRVTDPQGKPLLDLWIRKALPATAKPGGPEGAILLPFLEVGQLVGVVRITGELYDYRDQPIEPGVYSLRYGRQPVNGDHLGVSTYRDYALAVPVASDKELAPIPQDQLDKHSAEAAGTNHPAVFILLAAPAGSTPPAVAHDEAENRWGLVLPLSLQVPGQDAAALPLQLIFVGHGPV